MGFVASPPLPLYSKSHSLLNPEPNIQKLCLGLISGFPKIEFLIDLNGGAGIEFGSEMNHPRTIESAFRGQVIQWLLVCETRLSTWWEALQTPRYSEVG
jgi:hypothetical protein